MFELFAGVLIGGFLGMVVMSSIAVNKITDLENEIYLLRFEIEELKKHDV